MPFATTDDGVRLHYEETGSGSAGDLRARVRRRPSQLGAADAPLRQAPPLHRLQRARLSALRRAGGGRRLFAGARGGRHRARCSTISASTKAHVVGLVDGRLRDAAFRLPPSRPRAVALRRRLRLRRRAGRARALPGARPRSIAAGLRSSGMAAFRREIRLRPDARAVREQGPARLRRVQGDAGASTRRWARRTRSSACSASGPRSTTSSRRCAASPCRR